jgi:hypothetical protein
LGPAPQLPKRSEFVLPQKRLPKTSLEFLLVFGFVFWFFVLFNVNTTFHFAVSDVWKCPKLAKTTVCFEISGWLVYQIYFFLLVWANTGKAESWMNAVNLFWINQVICFVNCLVCNQTWNMLCRIVGQNPDMHVCSYFFSVYIGLLIVRSPASWQPSCDGTQQITSK